ncbi:MAG TPA: hypothetical protein VI199_01725 [Novosphingobium sp.]
MTYQFRALAEQAQTDGLIDGEELLALRRAGWGDGGRIDPSEADAIFTINHHLSERSAEWVDFFVAAIGQFLITGGRPRGFVNDAQADWLIGRLDRDGRIETTAELELLGYLFDKAERLPERLRGYALDQIEQIVLTSDGPTRDGGRVDGACITDSECRLLRRFLFSFAGDGPGGVSQAEAEMLFRIKDATLGAANSAEWPRLFVQGVANYLMASNTFRQVSAAEALATEAFLADNHPRVGSFFGRMTRADGEQAFGRGFGQILGFGRKGAGRDRAAERAVAHKLSDSEEAWLQQQVDANHQLDDLEKALLRFIAREERQVL